MAKQHDLGEGGLLGKNRVKILCLILVFHTALLCVMAVQDAPTSDEFAHLPAAIVHVKTGRFDLYRVNPPLARLVGALGPIILGADVSACKIQDCPGIRSDFTVATQFLMSNKNWELLFLVSRLSCVPISGVGLFFCYLWSKKLYGSESALMAATMWCCSPMMLGWGHTIMPDVSAAVSGLVALYSFRLWLRSSNLSLAFLTGLSLGVALATKGTWVILLLVFPTVWAVCRYFRRDSQNRLLLDAIYISTILLLGIFTLNLFYGFEKTGRPLGEIPFISHKLSGNQFTPGCLPVVGNRFTGSWEGSVLIPFPENYLRGLDWICWEFEKGYPSFLFGERKHGGWWYYYLIAAAIKVPLGFLIIGLMAGTGLVWKKKWLVLKEESFLLLPPLIIVVLVSSQTGFNHHLRYILPAFPFLFIWASKSVRLFKHCHAAQTLIAILLLWSTFSSLSSFPHSIGYFNELVGGSSHGYRYLDKSNVDVGQDTYYVRSWQKRNPEAKPFFYDHPSMRVVPKLARIDCSAIPSSKSVLRAIRDGRVEVILKPGWYAVSSDLRDSHSYFDAIRPETQIAFSTLVYKVDSKKIELIKEYFKDHTSELEVGKSDNSIYSAMEHRFR